MQIRAFLQTNPRLRLYKKKKKKDGVWKLCTWVFSLVNSDGLICCKQSVDTPGVSIEGEKQKKKVEIN